MSRRLFNPTAVRYAALLTVLAGAVASFFVLASRTTAHSLLGKGIVISK